MINNTENISIKIISKSTSVTTSDTIDLEISIDVFDVVYAILKRLLLNTVTCEVLVYMFIISTYKNKEFKFDSIFKNSFKEYCKHMKIREFKDISIKKAICELNDNNVLIRKQKGIYTINTSFIYGKV